MAANDLGQQIAAWVERRIGEILAAPRMWGAGLEAVELQLLTLMEVRALAVNFDREFEQPRRILDEYVRLLGKRFPELPNRPLHALVGEEGDHDFVAIARELSEALRGPVPVAEDDGFFAHTYLGIELRFASGQALSTQAVTGFYEDFRRATRSLARVGGGRTGRVERAVEMATDFVLESMQVTPLNGVPARARLALGIPYGQLELRGGRVQEALERIMDAAARADTQRHEEMPEFGADLDVETRTRVLLQTMRVVPRGGIEEVTIGGSCISRAPVRLRKIHAPKLMAAVGDHLKSSQYDHTALIRAIDLDRGSISHGNAPRDRIACFVTPERFADITQVGVFARIVGQHYEPPNGQPFVIAEQIEVLAERSGPRDRSVGSRA